MRNITAIFLLFVATSQASENLVPTPSGMRPRGMIHLVRDGEGVRRNHGQLEIYRVSDGRAVRAIDESKTWKAPPQTREWISDAFWQPKSGHSVSSFRATWLVPPTPASSGGQLIYYFNGISNSARNDILQPVLQWGTSPAGGGRYWAIASWYVTSSGQMFHTRPIQVKSGDKIVGVMKLSQQRGPGNFSYLSEFAGVNGTRLPVDNLNELVWCNLTLESYNVGNCSQYPSGTTSFKDIELRMSDGAPDLEWTAENRVTSCQEHTDVISNSTTAGQVDITVD